MSLFSRPSSAFASTSRCRSASPLPPRPATASRIRQPLSTPSKTSSRPNAQSFVSWEMVPTLKPSLLSPPTSTPSPPAFHSPPEEDPASWEVIDEDISASTSSPSSLSSLSGSSLESEDISHSDAVPTFDPERTSLSGFDTETFPAHAHLFPSLPNGTWRNESLHALTHPTAVDYTALCTNLRVLAEEASDELSARINRAFQGKDVPAMHDKVLGILPSVPMPDTRDFERAVDAGCDWGAEVLDGRLTRNRRRRW